MKASEQRTQRNMRALGRLLAYRSMLTKDEVLEDTLEAMRSGIVLARLDSMLSQMWVERSDWSQI